MRLLLISPTRATRLILQLKREYGNDDSIATTMSMFSFNLKAHDDRGRVGTARHGNSSAIHRQLTESFTCAQALCIAYIIQDLLQNVKSRV
ncbi:uncharacterized protein MYCFIDRAFT_206644 [Pseudocercospora fijiensis CIRAD86]|uniref:Uncharacterized protein n=1 Tax=Pseudocercospora fijiensis (strain CIRAD86) TaxID=383855 RepID=M3A432_PSEFD|nr:uncharacterized protein MYCFIDRAFT_206644 [Pseudocercospora fijiensis CIRAD86]EME85869.1 hypothetical protein MYCFIDRAFT_206644 [Pseudocercospora fijiensis CIRAD86]